MRFVRIIVFLALLFYAADAGHPRYGLTRLKAIYSTFRGRPTMYRFTYAGDCYPAAQQFRHGFMSECAFMGRFEFIPTNYMPAIPPPNPTPDSVFKNRVRDVWDHGLSMLLKERREQDDQPES